MVRGWLAGLTLCCLLMMGAQVMAAPMGKPRASGRSPGLPSRFDPTFATEGAEEVARLCAEKIISGQPLTPIASSDLLLDEIALHTEAGYYTVRVPLIHPKNHIERVLWEADTIEEVTTFVRFLQSGKIKIVKAKAFANEFVPEAKQKASTADFEACTGDELKSLLAPCRDCEVIEWILGKGSID